MTNTISEICIFTTNAEFKKLPFTAIVRSSWSGIYRKHQGTILFRGYDSYYHGLVNHKAKSRSYCVTFSESVINKAVVKKFLAPERKS